MKRTGLPLLGFMLFILCSCRTEAGSGPVLTTAKNSSTSNVIELDPGAISGRVNPLLTGTNFIAYDPATYEDRSEPYYGYSNYGAGVWDPSAMDVNAEAAAYAKEAGVSMARFPGGCGAHVYDWKRTIWPVETRPNFKYGLDEFLKTSEAVGSGAVITLSYYVGNSQDAADLVEYLNSPNDGANPGGGDDWASVRAANGHPEPYGVKYFEFGNEEYHGNHKDIKKVNGVDYGRRFIDYSQAMKAIDPDIMLGAVTLNPTQTYYEDWNTKVFQTAGQHIDFLVEHTYDSGKKTSLKNEEPKDWQIESIYRDALDNIWRVEDYYRRLSADFEKITGRKGVQIAVTEYNANFIRDSQFPYRHTLGTALFNAGLIHVFMRPENNVMMANYWQFINSSWGMLKNDSFMQGTGTYTKRPNFYVLKLFNEHFGEKLLSYRSSSGELLVSASLSEDGKKIYVSVINKNMTSMTQASVKVRETALAESARAWVLNGAAIYSTNEMTESVKIEETELQLQNGLLEMKFQPHSLTFIELSKK